ncbi:hypothetical protein EI94DRAFT_1805150 [Lactarius quietus]|nr:hypothetical protein EI94DRAFT_1805150 [Lactarius quietus]
MNTDASLDQCGEVLSKMIVPFHRSDKDLKNMLDAIWAVVTTTALPNVPDLGRPIATHEEFVENVQRLGEEEVLVQLKNACTSRDWLIYFLNARAHFRFAPSLKLQSPWPVAEATLRSWNTAFSGDAADALFMTISSYLDKRREDVYARFSTIVNSSGAGKSRMVDQVAIKVVTIPMCLRGDERKSIPPADMVLRQWFETLSEDRNTVGKKVHGLFWALFTVTSERLKSLETELRLESRSDNLSDLGALEARQEALAWTFHDCMTREQSFWAPNHYRRKFFKDVIERADEEPSRKSSGSDADGPQIPDTSERVLQAAEGLVRFLDPTGLLYSKDGPRRPLVILAFDEGHILAHIVAEQGSLFIDIRSALRIFVELPIFTLFLSTAAKSRLFSPTTESDLSLQVEKDVLKLLPPISEVAFDNLALPALENTVTLKEVTEDRWLSHLGRPLFGSCYDAIAEIERHRRDGDPPAPDLMKMAKSKLLDGTDKLDSTEGLGSLACLAVRFALEFDLSKKLGQEVARTQIERHMRLCVAASTGLERLITIAGSEPFLAEAARDLMSHAGAVWHLANNSSISCVDRGQRGEMVAALLIMHARDVVAAFCGSRAVSVDGIMRALLPIPAYEMLISTKPRDWRAGEDMPFSKAFEGYSMWFNHIIKVHQSEMINTEHL